MEEDAKAGLCHLVAEDEGRRSLPCAILSPCFPRTTFPVRRSPIADAPNAEDALRAAAEDRIRRGGRRYLRLCGGRRGFVELQGSFRFRRDGLAKLSGGTVGMLFFNGAYIGVDSCDKAARLIRFCDALPSRSSVCGRPLLPLCARRPAFPRLFRSDHRQGYGRHRRDLRPGVCDVAGRGTNADLTLAWPSAAIPPRPGSSRRSAMERPLEGARPTRSSTVRSLSLSIKKPRPRRGAAAAGYVEDIIDPADTRAEAHCRA